MLFSVEIFIVAPQHSFRHGSHTDGSVYVLWAATYALCERTYREIRDTTLHMCVYGDVGLLALLCAYVSHITSILSDSINIGIVVVFFSNSKCASIIVFWLTIFFICLCRRCLGVANDFYQLKNEFINWRISAHRVRYKYTIHCSIYNGFPLCNIWPALE